MSRIIFTIFLGFSFSLLMAQPVEIVWQNTIGGDDIEFQRVLRSTSDGNYLVGGFSSSDISGDKTTPLVGVTDMWILKIDQQGAIIWQRGYGGDDYDELFAVEETMDGGYILGGTSRSGVSGDKTVPTYGNDDYWVIKTNSAGTIEWQISLGGSAVEDLSSVKQTPDGGYIVAGRSQSDASPVKSENAIGDYDYWVVKLSATGTIEWENTIGGDAEEAIWDLALASDGGYLLAGASVSGISGDKTEANVGGVDLWIVKINISGEVEWDEVIGGDQFDTVYSTLATPDNGFILAGYSDSGISGDKTETNYGETDYWVMKINAFGELVWQNTIAGPGIDRVQAANCINRTSDGGYILGGWSNSNAGIDKTEDSRGGNDFWIVKLDDNGIVEFEKTIGGADTDLLRSIFQINSGNYMVAGRSDSDASGDKSENSNGNFDFWILELSPTLNIIDAEITNNLTVYPNPVNQILSFRAEGFTIDKINVLDVSGRLISTIQPTDLNVDMSHLNAGTYMVEFISGERSTVKRVVKN